MATRETEIGDAPLSALAADIKTEPKARTAWLEVAAARMAAQLIRNARARSGMTQPDVARALDLTQARISQIESGRVEDMPSLELLMRFVDACGEQLVLSTTATQDMTAGRPQRERRRDNRGRAPIPSEEIGTPQPLYEAEAEAEAEPEAEAEGAVARPGYAHE